MKKEDLTRVLRDEYGWDPNDVKKIWAFGLEDYIANCIVDKTVGMQYMKEVKSMIIDGFLDVLRSGPLCGERMRGVCFKVMDAKLHQDPMHRGAGSILPMASKGCRAAFLAAEPRLMEPVFLCVIQTDEERRGAVYNCIGNRRGQVIDDE